MRRALHLASLLLLIASLGAAEAPATRDGRPAFGAHYISVLLAQQDAALAAQTTFTPTNPGAPGTALAAAELSRHNIPWTPRNPIAQTAAVHAVTGSSL